MGLVVASNFHSHPSLSGVKAAQPINFVHPSLVWKSCTLNGIGNSSAVVDIST